MKLIAKVASVFALTVSFSAQSIEIPIPNIEALVGELRPKIYNWQYTSIENEIKCLAKNIYFEAAHEEPKGKVAVALVTINRVKSAYFPDSICEVVWEARKHRKTGRMVAMFSWTRNGKPNQPTNTTLYQDCLVLAEHILRNNSIENLKDFTGGATHYHATYVSPKWRHDYERVQKIGLHVFYRHPKYGVYQEIQL